MQGAGFIDMDLVPLERLGQLRGKGLRLPGDKLRMPQSGNRTNAASGSRRRTWRMSSARWEYSFSPYQYDTRAAVQSCFGSG